MNILGISAFYHDSASCLVQDGKIVSAAQEERFSRKKHDPSFPINAIKYCLTEGKNSVNQLDYIVFYDKPILTFERLLLTYLTIAPKGLVSWIKSMPLWIGKKLYIPKIIKKELGYEGDVLFTEHHESHAASAFYPSPFNEASILTIDGVGEWATACYGFGKGNALTLLKELNFPDSLGLLYSAFTYFTGFRVNFGEYKLMGLAPYGKPIYKDIILNELIDLKEDGSLRLNLKYFDFLGGLRMTNNKFAKLFGGPSRKPETEITQREMDIAASIQQVTEEAVLKMVTHVHKETNMENICLAGGVALNCVANGRILREGPFKNIWIQPAAGDAGGAVGAALSVWYRYLENKKIVHDNNSDFQSGSYLGPAYSADYIKNYLEKNNYTFHHYENEILYKKVAEQIANGKIVGYFSGRMEFGPRALGARSILGDPRRTETQTTMNLKIKFRESFRPFAPSVLEEKCSEYFSIDKPSPYMLLVANVKKDRCFPQQDIENLGILERIKNKRSDIPAVTHLDYSARIQTVNSECNPGYYSIISEFEKLTGFAVIVNTSFNVRGEPIVCTPEDAYKCFMRTEMDTLVLENYILIKTEQPPWKEGKVWKRDLILD